MLGELKQYVYYMYINCVLVYRMLHVFCFILCKYILWCMHSKLHVQSEKIKEKTPHLPHHLIIGKRHNRYHLPMNLHLFYLLGHIKSLRVFWYIFEQKFSLLKINFNQIHIVIMAFCHFSSSFVIPSVYNLCRLV